VNGYNVMVNLIGAGVNNIFTEDTDVIVIRIVDVFVVDTKSKVLLSSMKMTLKLGKINWISHS